MQDLDYSALNQWQWKKHFFSQLPEACAPCKPQVSPNPKLVFWNQALAQSLLMGEVAPEILAQVFSGNYLPEGIFSVAQAYAGHQFGQFNPQLGDGRAHLLGEIKNTAGELQDVALKGSGTTPFSRGGDGRAAIGPMLREVLLSESLQALGIPTTRALAVVATGAPVYRQTPLQGAVLTRTAASHIRIGTFQWMALQVYQGALPVQALERLADFAIVRHFPKLSSIQDEKSRYLAFFEAVVEKQAHLLAHWMSVGFIHGVMNTDNMSIAGETIDFGPCAMLESYDPNAVFSSIDHQGRYAFGNQPAIAQWNLARLAEALLPLLSDFSSSENDAKEVEAIKNVKPILQKFTTVYSGCWMKLWQRKLGLDALDAKILTPLVEDFLSILHSQSVDFTLACRGLSDTLAGHSESWLSLFDSPKEAEQWLGRWHRLLVNHENFDDLSIQGFKREKAEALRKANPIVIARNHHVESALDAADTGDYSVFERLLEAVRQPYCEKQPLAEFSHPATQEFTQNYQTFCGT